MPSAILMQFQDFLSQAEVTALYSSIHKLHLSKLQEALRIRGLSQVGDESTLRVRLLRFEMQFYHPEIQIPWYNSQKYISQEEVANVQMRMDALCDMTRMLCAESIAAAELDAKAKQATLNSDKSKTCANANDSSHNEDKSENQVKYRLNCVKLLKVCDLQYSGTKGLPAQDFLENLEDFRKFSKINERVLLETLACVLDIDTKKWYRASNFNDWQSFKQKFIENYVRLDEKIKQQTIDRATQTDTNSSLDEVKNRVVLPLKKSLRVHMPVSKTLQDLKNSLSNIGFKSIDTTLKKTQIPMVLSSNSEIKATVQSKIETTTRQASNVNKVIDARSTSKMIVPTTATLTPQNVNVTVKNNSTLVSTANGKNQSQFPQSAQIIHIKDAVQLSINSQLNTSLSNEVITNNVIPTIAISAIPNLVNPVIVKSQAVVSQNNTPIYYTNPINNTQSTNNNVITKVNPGQITTSNGGCYLYARHQDFNAANLGQNYLTSQPLNYGYGTYHYPMDCYVPNGFRHC